MANKTKNQQDVSKQHDKFKFIPPRYNNIQHKGSCTKFPFSTLLSDPFKVASVLYAFAKDLFSFHRVFKRWSLIHCLLSLGAGSTSSFSFDVLSSPGGVEKVFSCSPVELLFRFLCLCCWRRVQFWFCRLGGNSLAVVLNLQMLPEPGDNWT